MLHMTSLIEHGNHPTLSQTPLDRKAYVLSVVLGHRNHKILSNVSLRHDKTVCA